LLQVLFGHKAIATKAFIIILLVLAIIWILYSFNFSLPKISLQNEKKPKFTSKKAKPTKYEKTTKEEISDRSDFGKPVSRSLIKSLIKNKIENKIQETEKVQVRKNKPMINFSAEKPTFNVNILDTNSNQAVTIDESFLMEKAKALQNKLMEFNVPIMIE
jgi:hypothetical protein